MLSLSIFNTNPIEFEITGSSVQGASADLVLFDKNIAIELVMIGGNVVS